MATSSGWRSCGWANKEALFFDNTRLEWLRKKVATNAARIRSRVEVIEGVLGNNFSDWDDWEEEL